MKHSSSLFLILILTVIHLSIETLCAYSGISRRLERVETYAFPGQNLGNPDLSTSNPAGPVSLGASSADGDSPGHIIGRTFNDWEGLDMVRHMVGWRNTPGVHFVFQGQLVGGSEWNISATWTSYVMFDPTIPPNGAFSSEVWLHPEPFLLTGWMPNMDVDTTGHAVVAAYILTPDLKGPVYNAGIYRDIAGPGAYGTFLLDSLLRSVSTYPDKYLGFPHVEVQQYNGQQITHVAAVEMLDPRAVGYYRRVGSDPTPGGWTHQSIHTEFRPKYNVAMAVSPVNGDVAILFMTVGGGDICYNIAYVESTDGGGTWPDLTPIEIVNIDNSIGSENWLPWTGMDAMYDTDGYLHIIYNAALVSNCSAGGIDPSRIYHWTDRVTGDNSGGKLSLVTIADFHNLVSMCGRGRVFVDNMAKGTISQCDSNLVVLWQQFGDPDAGDSLDCAAGGEWFGSYNADLYMSISSSLDGSFWDAGRNITNSKSPGCDTVNNFENSCDHDNYASMSRYAMNVSEMGTTYWNAVPEAFEVSDFLDPSYPHDGSFIDVRYIDDLYPEMAMYTLPEAIWTYNPVKWFRLPCVNPVFLPDILCIHDNFLTPVDWVKCGESATIENVVIQNIGNATLSIYSVEPVIETGSLDWITVETSVSAIEPGETGQFSVTINPGGIVTTQERLDAEIVIESDDSDHPILTAFEIHTVISDTVVPVVWDTIMTPSGFGLMVANQGSAGNSGLGNVNMDFAYVDSSGPECLMSDGVDYGDNVYLHDLCPIIMHDGTGTPGSYSWNPFWVPLRSAAWNFVAVVDGTEASQCGRSGFDLYQTNTFVTSDSAIACRKYWIAPHADVSFFIERWELYSHAGDTIPGVRLGNWTDWDIPTQTYGNQGGVVQAVGGVDYAFQKGSVDPASDPTCLDPERRFGATGLLGYYTSSEKGADPDINHTGLYGAHVNLDDDLFDKTQFVFVVDSVWSWLTRSTMDANNSQDADQQILLSYGSFDIIPEDTLVIWTVYASVYDGDESDLQELINSAMDWYLENRERVGTCDGCCGRYNAGITGNTNCDEEGKLTLSDITRLIDYVYISKSNLCCYANGNANGSLDCKVTLSDITTLIDAVYISKADPQACLAGCER